MPDPNNSDAPAFPFIGRPVGLGKGAPGLTKREAFAGLAMLGIIAEGSQAGLPDRRAEWAVKHADALLAELAKREKQNG